MTTRRNTPPKVSLTARARALVPNLLRLAAFLLVLYVVGLAVVARQVRAETNEIMMGVGAQMMQYADADAQDAPRTLVLNGQQLAFGSGHTDDHDVGEVLDFFQARCSQRNGRLVDHVRELASERDVPASETSMLDGTLRESTPRGGYVACFDVGEERESFEGLLARLTAFTDSGNLAELGGLRYVYARALENGGTHFLVFHTDDRLNIYEMFPATGDAPGADPAGLPRPASVRRLLSAWEDGDPHAINIYTSTTRDAAELHAWYQDELPRAGWTLYEPTEAQLDRFTRHWEPADRDAVRDAHAIHAEHGDRHVMLVMSDDRAGEQSAVSVLTTR
ncbi:MAG: hypothetical protein M3Y87_01325 [Myxococcota bacterium]|nr:hypothetical protein [Myxococcota bacterium]